MYGLTRHVSAPVALSLLLMILGIHVFEGAAHDGGASEPTPVVFTPTGQVRGTVRSAPAISNKPVFTFLGVPFAAPPVGDLRFRPPQPVAPWEGVLSATEFGPNCPQDLARGRRVYDLMHIVLPHEIVSEDCLVLNIMTTTLDTSAALPVMVWLHGGSLVSGAGGLYNFTALAAHQNVVVVTVNYRLGAFGFLSTGDDNAPGNYGFLDQVEALRWIKSNIRNFGGDPDLVTIFGESAGALSVSYLVLSPLANGLFHRAISQSATVLTPPTTTDNPLAAAAAQAEEVGCGAETIKAMMSCLRLKPFQDIVESASHLERKLDVLGSAIFSPVVDDYFLLDPPLVALQKKEFSTVPYLLGVNNHEFGYLLPSSIPGFGNGIPQDHLGTILKDLLSKATQADNVDELVTALLHEYRDTDQSGDPMDVQMKFTQIMGDVFIVVPTVVVASQHAASGGRVYLYENQHRPATSTKPAWVGSDHTDDLLIVTGTPFLGEDGPTYPSKPLSFSEGDKKLSLDMMAYWANFARTGNPSDPSGSPSLRPNLTTWPPYTPDNPAYLKLAVTSSAEVGLKASHVRFWYDVLYKQPLSDASENTAEKEEL